MPTVNIPGYDQPVNFPDSMTKDQINEASHNLYVAKQTGMTPGKMQPTKFDSPQPKSSAFDKTAGWVTHNAPLIMGGLGAAAGTAIGPEGTIAGGAIGAAIGGGSGSAIKQKAEQGKVKVGTVAKDAAVQGAYDLGGGLAMKGIAKTAQILGIPEAMMKFALKSGEDLEQGVNPAAAINKFKLKAATTAALYVKTRAQSKALNMTADAIMDKALPYSSSVRPYAVIKGVLDKYEDQAAKTADPEIRSAMQKMLHQVEGEFNSAGTDSASGSALRDTERDPANQMGEVAKQAEAAKLPTDKVMSVKDANRLKSSWGKTVDWSKSPPVDKMQAVYKAEMSARREVYNSLNHQIADALGGNEGRAWLSTNKDIQQLMEASSFINESAKAHQVYGQNLLQTVTDMARKPGPASQGAAFARMVENAARDNPQAFTQAGRVGLGLARSPIPGMAAQGVSSTGGFAANELSNR